MMESYFFICIIIVLLIIIIFLFIRNKRHKRTQVREKIVEYYENTQTVKKTYECLDRCKDGEEKLYYPSGNLNRIRHWSNDVLNGEMVVFYNNGNVYIRGYYKNGNLSGEYTVFKENGDLLTKKRY